MELLQSFSKVRLLRMGRAKSQGEQGRPFRRNRCGLGTSEKGTEDRSVEHLLTSWTTSWQCVSGYALNHCSHARNSYVGDMDFCAALKFQSVLFKGRLCNIDSQETY